VAGVLFWLLVGGALLLALHSLAGLRRSAGYYRRKLPDVRQTGYLPPVALIVPVKGPEEGLRENLASLASLDYPDYELIVAARDGADIPPDVTPPRARVVLAGEAEPGTGEKIHNLTAAIRCAAPAAEVFAFADSDGRVSSGWLRALVAPLANPGTGASTGYRCYLPDPPDFWPLLRSVWNAAILGSFGPGNNRLAWGGAMALRREVFFRTRVLEFWQGSVSDDYGVAAAVHRAGLEVSFAPGALVVSADHTSAGEFLSWVRRQLVITRVYNPKLWWLSLAATAAYSGAMAASAAAAIQGHAGAGVILGALVALEVWKGAGRTRLARAALPESRSWFDRYGWLQTWCAPVATWLWLYALLASAPSNVIEWRGNRYRLSRRTAPSR
jgi:ceramide glucosyltransferase